MRPEDTDVIARVIAHNVKKLGATLRAEMSPPSPQDDTALKALEASVEALTKTVRALQLEIANRDEALVKANESRLRSEQAFDNETIKLRKEIKALQDLPPPIIVETDEAGILKKAQDAANAAIEASRMTPQQMDMAIAKAVEQAVSNLDLKPLAPNDLQVLEAVKTLYPAIRTEVVKLLPRIEHKGVHEAGREYEPGDEVIKGDSTYRAKYATSENPPHEDWQCIAKSKVGRRGQDGAPGEKGAQGPQGPAGTGIENWAFEDGVLSLVLTSGEAIVIDLEIEDKLTKAVADFMNKGATE